MKKKNNSKISDSASSHRYSTGDYSAVNKYECVTKVPVIVKKKKKRISKGKSIFIVIFIILTILILNNRTISKISNAAKVRPPTPFISEQLKKMQITNDTVEKIVGTNYTKDAYASESSGGKSISFYLKYDKKDALNSVSVRSYYEYDRMSTIDENMNIRLEELKVNQGIKIDDRIKSIILAFSANLPYDEIIAEESRLYASVNEGKSSQITSDFGDVTVTITVNYKEEHRKITFTFYKTLKSDK